MSVFSCIRGLYVLASDFASAVRRLWVESVSVDVHTAGPADHLPDSMVASD